MACATFSSAMASCRYRTCRWRSVSPPKAACISTWSASTYYVGRESLIPSDQIPGMALWRERLFAFLSRNAVSATAFYRLPPERVVELGIQVEM